jgi:hypothetical protein
MALATEERLAEGQLRSNVYEILIPHKKGLEFHDNNNNNNNNINASLNTLFIYIAYI